MARDLLAVLADGPKRPADLRRGASGLPLLEIGGAGFWTVLGSQNHRDHFLLFHHKITKEKKTKEFFVSVLKNMGFIQVEESHHGYLSEMLTGDAFSERILGNLDVSVAFVLSTIAKSEKIKC